MVQRQKMLKFFQDLIKSWNKKFQSFLSRIGGYFLGWVGVLRESVQAFISRRVEVTVSAARAPLARARSFLEVLFPLGVALARFFRRVTTLTEEILATIFLFMGRVKEFLVIFYSFSKRWIVALSSFVESTKKSLVHIYEFPDRCSERLVVFANARISRYPRFEAYVASPAKKFYARALDNFKAFLIFLVYLTLLTGACQMFYLAWKNFQAWGAAASANPVYAFLFFVKDLEVYLPSLDQFIASLPGLLDWFSGLVEEGAHLLNVMLYGDPVADREKFYRDNFLCLLEVSRVGVEAYISKAAGLYPPLNRGAAEAMLAQHEYYSGAMQYVWERTARYRPEELTESHLYDTLDYIYTKSLMASMAHYPHEVYGQIGVIREFQAHLCSRFYLLPPESGVSALRMEEWVLAHKHDGQNVRVLEQIIKVFGPNSDTFTYAEACARLELAKLEGLDFDLPKSLQEWLKHRKP